MALETKLLQKLSQSLLMTPQLQQAIKLLQLGRLEYKEAIERELLDNPILEEIKETDEAEPNFNTADSSSNGSNDSEDSSSPTEPAQTPQNEKGPVEWDDYIESFIDSRGSAGPKGSQNFEERPGVEATLTKEESLQDYLLSQIRYLALASEDEHIALSIIGNLDRNGYLCSTYEEIAQSCACDGVKVAEVMQLIQNLDPPGIGARNLSECLMIQLQHMGLENSLEARIVRNHLDKLERKKYENIAKDEGVELEQIYKAVQAIQRLEPRPGRPFADESPRYIVPDIFVQKVGGEWVISLNEDGLPRLRVSSYYLDLLKNDESANVPNKAYLNERLKAATWLIKSIHQRQQTIYRVTESIVKFQREFLDHGIDKLRPLVLKDVADDIGMHESTVSRVTTNKYVHTPQGVYELKYFFTTGIRTSGGDVSSSSVKERIKILISAEQPSQPISDQEIVEILKKENIDIARRTVAKYRESLGILSSSKRKKLF